MKCFGEEITGFNCFVTPYIFFRIIKKSNISDGGSFVAKFTLDEFLYSIKTSFPKVIQADRTGVGSVIRSGYG